MTDGPRPVQRPLQRAVVLLACTALLGCSTLQAVDAGGDYTRRGPAGLQVQDEVAVELRSGETLALKLTAVGPDWFEGRAAGAEAVRRVQRDEVAGLQRKTLDAARSWLLVGGLVALVAALAASAARSIGASIAGGG